MFKMTETHRFSWPVKVKLPSSENPGTLETQTFTGHFRLLKKDEAAALAAAMEIARMKGIAAADAAELDQIRAALEGWSDVVDDDGRPVAFSADALALACSSDPVRRAIAVAYGEGASGEARVGN